METLHQQALAQLRSMIQRRPELWLRAHCVLMTSYLLIGEPQPIDPRYPPEHPVNGPAMITMLGIARGLLMQDRQRLPANNGQ